MESQRVFRLRVTYQKAERLALLSHLEITHALERMVRRASLPFALSNGFSPHMKIAFGSALPVGIGSTCEIFDVQLTDYVPPAKALVALQKGAPLDLMPLVCTYIEPRAKAASVAFPYSVYEALYKVPLGEVLIPDAITVMKKKKEKVLTVKDFLVGEPQIDGCKFIFQLQQTEQGNLRPDDFISACRMHALDEGTKPRILFTSDTACELDESFKPCEPLEPTSITRIAQADSPLS